MADAVLQVRGLSAGYRDRKVIQDLSLPAFEAGNVYSLVGPNGAGKSTLMRALAGLQPASGSVTLAGCELIGRSLSEHAKEITYMPQTLPQGVALSVLESVISALHASPIGDVGLSRHSLEQRAVAVLKRVGIIHLALDSLGQLSGGQRQLVSLAQSLVREPRVLLLDEPISALDLQHQLRVMKMVHALSRERGMISLVVLHDLQAAARWSDGIVMMSRGQLIASGTPGVAITPQTLAQVYGVRARIEHCSQGMLQILVDDVLPTAEETTA